MGSIFVCDGEKVPCGSFGMDLKIFSYIYEQFLLRVNVKGVQIL